MKDSFELPLHDITLETKSQELGLFSAETRETHSVANLPLIADDASEPKHRQQALIILSCLSLTFTGCGINFAFGVYQELYETLDGPFSNASPADIALIGTLAACLMTVGAPIATAWTNSIGPRRVVLLGGLCFTLSGITASFATRLWHFQVSQGFLQGCAACLTYIPAVTVPPGYFSERRALVMGIITSGTGFGGMAWAPFLRFLMSAIGLRNTLRTAGVLAAAMTVFSATVFKSMEDANTGHRGTRPNSEKRRAIDWRLVQSPEFVAHASGTCLQAAAYMIPIYFMSSYARTLGFSSTAGANVIALSNACNSGGKIVIGYSADRLGRLNALVLSTLVSAAITFGLFFVSRTETDTDIHRALFVAYGCIYGITAGAYVSLFPTALIEQFGMQGFSRVNGLLYMIRGLGTLVGTPLGGALVRHTSEAGGAAESSGFDTTFLFVGILLLGATMSVAWARSLSLNEDRTLR